MPIPTVDIAAPKGVWRPVYARRRALHATADALILTAWRRDTRGLDLAPAAQAWQGARAYNPDRDQRQDRQQAAAAVLAALQARNWDRTRHALAVASQKAHRAGWQAGRHLATTDLDDDTDYEDGDPTTLTVGNPDLSDQAAASGAAAVLARILAATAPRAGRHMADSTGDDPVGDGEDVVDDGYDAALAADTAVSAAYGAGLLAAFLSLGAQSLVWTTAGDGRVCVACQDNEANSPYSPFAVPALPAHPRCRCTLAPA